MRLDEKRRKAIIRILIWLSCGILLALVGGVMCVSGEVNLNQFYSVGNSYIVNYGEIRYERYVYDEEKEIYRLPENTEEKIVIYGREQAWECVEIEITKLSTPSMEAEIVFESEQAETRCIPYVFEKGKNVIESEGVPFGRIYIRLKGKPGDGIYIKNAIMWENYKPFNYITYAETVAVVFAVYVLISVAMEKLIRRISEKKQWSWNSYRPLYFMQRIYGYILLCGYNVIKVYFPELKERSRHIVRVLVLLTMYFCSIFYSNHGIGSNWVFFYMVYIILFLLLAFACYEGSNEPMPWDHLIPKAWFYLLLLMSVSDFIVPKRWAWAGLIMLFAIGIFIYSWNSMKESGILIEEFMTTLHISYVFCFIFCLVCRPQTNTLPAYLGIYISPNMFAFYLICVLVAGLTELNRVYMKAQKRRYIYIFIAEILSASYFIYLTKSQTGILTETGIIIVWLLEKFLKVEKQYRRKVHFWLLRSIVVMGIPIIMGMSWCIKNLPALLGTQVIMEKDYYVENIADDWKLGVMQVNAQERESNLLDKVKNTRLLDKYFSGRITIWKNYIIDLNLFGHYGKKVFQYHLPHEAFIAMAYRYGIFVLIPYIFLWGGIVVKCIGMLIKYKNWKAYFPAMGCISYIVIAAFNEVERPFGYVNWFVAYMMMGLLFNGSGENMEIQENV